MYETQPDTYLTVGGPRAAAGFIDIAVIVAAVAPLAIIDLGLAIIAGLVAGGVYAAILEGGPSGQTLGKRRTGLRVVDASTGGPIGHFRALVRHFCRLPFGIGFLVHISLHPERRPLYDWVLHTAVVPAVRPDDAR